MKRVSTYKIKIVAYVTIILICFVVFFSPHLNAQDSLPKKELPKYNFHQYKTEYFKFFATPAHWSLSDWLICGTVIGGTVALTQADNQVRNQFLRYPQYAHSLPVDIGNQWGGFFTYPALILGFGISGYVGDHPKSKKVCYELIESLLTTETVSLTLKGVTGRSRPFTERGPFSYKPFTILNSPYNSFPAGHVDAAICMSTIFARNSESGLLKVVFYLPTVLTAASRIYSDRHWASDVFFGAAIGYFGATWVVNNDEKKDSRIQMSSIYPLSFKIGLN